MSLFLSIQPILVGIYILAVKKKLYYRILWRLWAKLIHQFVTLFIGPHALRPTPKYNNSNNKRRNSHKEIIVDEDFTANNTAIVTPELEKGAESFFL